MLLALALTLTAGAPPSELPLAACAWVRAENDNAGSGFVVSVEKKLLVTCRHVIADRKKVDVYFPWVRDGALVTDRAEHLRNRDQLREQKLLVTGTVRKTSDDYDLALLELDALPASAKEVTFAPHEPQPGDTLRVVGNRLDLDTLWNVTTGPLRATGKLTDGYFWRGKKLALGANVIIAQLPAEEGDSGGPVFNTRGEVVGMDCALRRATPLAAVVISATDVRTFLGAPAKEEKAPEPSALAEALARATVWVKPEATEIHRAGALIEKDLVLTSARGLTPGDRVGIALPLREESRWVSARGAYRDPLALHLRGAWRGGVVLARDAARDLALIKLDEPSDQLKPLKFAEAVPNPGDALHAMNHPGGVEFAWVYASGSVRQRGRVALDLGDKAPRVQALVCQLPAQSSSPGGPLVNEKGELVGVLSAREGAQLVGYAATTGEIRQFLDCARRDRPARTLAGLLARVEAIPGEQAALLAGALAERAEQHRATGRLADAKRDCDTAVSLAPGCAEARLCRSRFLEPEPALVELDAAIEKGPFHRDALVRRAALAHDAKDYRKARGDSERVLSVFPADLDARELLARAHLGLNDEAKAASALGDLVRADAKSMKAAARVVLAHVDALEQKFPDSPDLAVAWLTKALTALEKGSRDPKQRAAVAGLLKDAAGTKDNLEHLKLLRAGAQSLR